MTEFRIVEGRPYHCGQMSRILRLDQQKAIALIGMNTHHEMRDKFDQSVFRKAWLINNRLAAVGGITGSILSAYGLVWLALSNEAMKYPLAVVKESRRQLNQAMITRHMLVTNILDGDEAAKRFAVFLGFVPYDECESLPASSIHGRRDMKRKIDESPVARSPLGNGFVVTMTYSQHEAA